MTEDQERRLQALNERVDELVASVERITVGVAKVVVSHPDYDDAAKAEARLMAAEYGVVL